MPNSNFNTLYYYDYSLYNQLEHIIRRVWTRTLILNNNLKTGFQTGPPPLKGQSRLQNRFFVHCPNEIFRLIQNDWYTSLPDRYFLRLIKSSQKFWTEQGQLIFLMKDSMSLFLFYELSLRFCNWRLPGFYFFIYFVYDT